MESVVGFHLKSVSNLDQCWSTHDIVHHPFSILHFENKMLNPNVSDSHNRDKIPTKATSDRKCYSEL